MAVIGYSSCCSKKCQILPKLKELVLSPVSTAISGGFIKLMYLDPRSGPFKERPLLIGIVNLLLAFAIVINIVSKFDTCLLSPLVTISDPLLKVCSGSEVENSL